MKIIVIDDEMAALNTFLYEIVDNADIECNMFLNNPLASVEYVKNNNVDVAFLDINMPGINGVDLAEKLIKAKKNINIIFISGFIQEEKQIEEKLGSNLIGFCYKPYNDTILKNYIKLLQDKTKNKKIIIKTFGGFDIFLNERPINFKCTKSKELLALLVNNKGGFLNMGDAIACLWPDKELGFSKRLYRDAVYRLRKTLQENKLDELVEFNRAKLTLNMKNINCDYWDFLLKDTKLYAGSYMPEYDWSIETQSILDNLYR